MNKGYKKINEIEVYLYIYEYRTYITYSSLKMIIYTLENKLNYA